MSSTLTRRGILAAGVAGGVALLLPRLGVASTTMATDHLAPATWAPLVGDAVTLHGDDGRAVAARVHAVDDTRSGFAIRFVTTATAVPTLTEAVTHPRLGRVALVAMPVDRASLGTFEAIVNTHPQGGLGG
jgi:hypothetical protein